MDMGSGSKSQQSKRVMNNATIQQEKKPALLQIILDSLKLSNHGKHF
jgi:hypothetical protein